MSILIKGMDMPQDGRAHQALFTFRDGQPIVIVETALSYDERHVDVYPICTVSSVTVFPSNESVRTYSASQGASTPETPER